MQTKSRMRFHWLEKLAFKALFRVYWYLVNNLTNFDPSIKERNSKTTLCRWWWCYFFSYSSLHTKEPTFKQWKDNISGISVTVVGMNYAYDMIELEYPNVGSSSTSVFHK